MDSGELYREILEEAVRDNLKNWFPPPKRDEDHEGDCGELFRD